MIKIQCRTNLDVREKWPEELPERPMVGDLIQSAIHWKPNRDPVELEVIRITWTCTIRQVYVDRCSDIKEPYWFCVVELHLPKYRFENITHFAKWYRELSGIQII